VRLALEHVRHCRSEQEAIERLQRLPGMTAAERTRLDKVPSAAAALQNGAMVRSAQELGKPGLEALTQWPAYFVQGHLDALERPTVAIVGTRGATTYGKAAAQKFAEEIGQAGAAIVSGGAFGIDSAAHQGALASGTPTIAVLPCGIDKVYPPANRDLFKRIAQAGLLLSQFACGYTPRKDSFLLRNIVIAALADAVLVVEAPEKSGALFTARHANEMGKPVYVVPAAITQHTFRGSHELIRQGATLVDHPNQVLEDLNLISGAAKANVTEVSGIQASILAHLSSEPIPAEKIGELSGIAPDDLMAELTLLELEGKIIRAAGGVTLAV
jgi:DNA processing protein